MLFKRKTRETMRDIKEGRIRLEDDIIVITQEDGTEKEYDVMFTFDCQENGKSYIAFADTSVKSRRRDLYFVYYMTGTHTDNLFLIEEDDEDLCRNTLEEIKRQF